jgi:hypothetical protein
MQPKKLVIFLAVVCSICLQPLPAWAQDPSKDTMPLSTSLSAADQYSASPTLNYRQHQARYLAEQSLMRMQWNKWRGYEPTRPNTNASYVSAGLYNFQPSQGYRTVYSVQNRFYGW